MRSQLLSAAIACACAAVLCIAPEASAGNARGAARGVAATDPPGNGDGFVRRSNGNGRGTVPGVQRGGGATRPTREGICPGVKVYGPLGQAGQSYTAHADFAEIDVVSSVPVVDGAWAGMS